MLRKVPEVQMLNVAKHLSISNRFNKTFEHTLNYNNDLSDNFNLDALVGYIIITQQMEVFIWKRL
jgi:hypothetical protein